MLTVNEKVKAGHFEMPRTKYQRLRSSIASRSRKAATVGVSVTQNPSTVRARDDSPTLG